MDPLSRAAIRIPTSSNTLVLRLAVACVALLLPLSLNNFVQGRILLGLLSLPVIVLFAMNVHCIIRRGHYYTKATNLFLAPLTLLMVSACIVELGVNGVLWSFPIALSYYLLLPERNAWFANALLVVVVTVLAYMAIELAVATRIFVTLATVSFTVAFLIKIIAEQQRSLRIQAITDPLSGAFNSNLLEPALSHAIMQSNRTSSEMSLIAMNVATRKPEKTQNGTVDKHSALRQITQMINKKCDETDRLFRLNGEEFLLLLHDTCPDRAQQLALEIHNDVTGSGLLADSEAACNIGVSTLQTSDSWREWMARGMANLCQAKATTQKNVAA